MAGKGVVVRNRIRRVALTATLVAAPLIGAVAVPEVASAADGANCVSVYGPPGVQDNILLINRWCGATVRVKIIESGIWPNSPCYTIGVGKSVNWSRPVWSFGSYEGLQNC